MTCTLVVTGDAVVRQFNVNVLWPAMGAVTTSREAIVPPVALAASAVPGPAKVQLTTFVADQVNTDVPPECTRDGDATSETLGTSATTDTVACVCVWSQYTVYVAFAPTVTFAEPLAARLLEKVFEFDVFGDGHDQVIVAVLPTTKLAVGPATTPGPPIVTVGGRGQLASEGAAAEHAPLHCTVPALV
ncbi:MAG: hypothetical protein NT019_01675 [Candidatus Adlerbacteria bacterium]|nr:hypothetical protein [Candidatus Adlerbacteria bacterium]